MAEALPPSSSTDSHISMGPGRVLVRRDANVGVQMARVGPLWLLTPVPPIDWGIIADLQCGGWSTAFLNSYGRLFVTGILNGETEIDFGDRGFRELQFEALDLQRPRKPAPASPVTDPKRAIRHFSSGRSHTLALSDDGTLWSWFSERQPAVQLSFPEIDASPVISKFVAGWSKSSAYIKAHGILV
jgi:SCF-associated factor 1